MTRLFKNGSIKRTELDKLLEENKKLVDAMTPEEKEEMHRRQRESWAKQDMD